MKKNKIVANFLLVLAISIFCTSAAFAAQSASPEAVEYYNAGLEYVNKEDYEKASLAFQKALDYDPEMVDAYYNLGSLYEHFGDYRTAIRAYTDVVALEPKDYETVYKIAELYAALNMKNEALNCLYSIPQNSAAFSQASSLLAQLTKEEPAQTKEPQQTSASTQTTTANVTETHANKPVYDINPSDYTMDGRTKSGGYTDPDKSLLSRYSSPTGIAIDRAGNIFIASYADNSIYVVSPEEKNSVFSDSPMIDGPIGIVADASGNLYVANYNKDNILLINPNGNVSIYKSNVMKPYALSIRNNTLYVSEQGTNSVVKFKLR